MAGHDVSEHTRSHRTPSMRVIRFQHGQNHTDERETLKHQAFREPRNIKTDQHALNGIVVGHLPFVSEITRH
jgi:hypothetical protein